MRKIFFAIISIAVLAMGMGPEHIIDYYFDPSAFYAVFMLTISVSLTIFPLIHIKYLLLHILNKKNQIPSKDIKTQRDFYLFSANTALATGVICQITGMIAMLYNMSDPSSIGPSLAWSMISILYGLILSQLILRPLAKGLELSTNIERKDTSSNTNLLITVLVPLLSVLNFFILLVAMSHIEAA